jgi:DNA-binding CsgD family transcriptional regulator
MGRAPALVADYGACSMAGVWAARDDPPRREDEWARLLQLSAERPRRRKVQGLDSRHPQGRAPTPGGLTGRSGVSNRGRTSPGGEPSKALTTTERVILRSLSEGATLTQIAEDLGRSLLTVRTHVRNARAKLDVRSTEELRRRLGAGEFDRVIAEPGSG